MFASKINSILFHLCLILSILSFNSAQSGEGSIQIENKIMKNMQSAYIENCLQLIFVATPSWPATRGLLQRYERQSAQDGWQEVGEPVSIVVGENGMAWGLGLSPVPTDAKFLMKESGKCAPAGIFPLGTAFGLEPQNSFSIHYPYRQITSSLECVDDPQSRFYNQIVDSTHEKKDWASSEKMVEFNPAYRLGIEIQHNKRPIQKAKGSCIFLHVWEGSTTPTLGCTAMSEPNMRDLLVWLDREKNPLLVQLPQLEIYRFQTQWSLPPQAIHLMDTYNSDLVNISEIDPTIHIEAVYSTPNHFFKKAFYPQNWLFAQRNTAERLKKIQDRLRKEGLSLKIWDAYRPWSVSKEMWELVKDNRYVADPAYGSKHNRGCAIDLTLVDNHGQELHMPTPYLDFSEKAHRSFSNLPQEALQNRQTLEKAMKSEGFEPYEEEWWHFNDPEWPEYPVLDVDVYEK